MSDVLTVAQRSKCMAAIKSKNTKPELAVRSLLSEKGYRYRLHRADLPGKPDITIPRLKIAILVHGCFWHIHRCRYGRVVPATNTEFWQAKRLGNVKRDKTNVRRLRAAGWRVFTVWECWTRRPQELQGRLEEAISEARRAE
jgi:DNA mismatch endonuclease (patch repair protein)